MTSTSIASVFVLMLLGVVADAADLGLPQPIRIESGLLAGVVNADGSVVAFKGVPYAAPPVGDRRWREPQPPIPWEGVRLADRAGAKCLQAPGTTQLPYSLTKAKNLGEAIPPSEDCLTLSIWTPARTGGDRLAVLVNLGGINGENLARKGIIVVAVTYRVGILGGMGHPELSKESPHRLSGNYGFLDMIAAIQWVQRNIAAFGGDPAKVTLAGYSVGSTFVHHLTASPVVRGMFRGAICMSFPYDYLMAKNKVGNVWQKEQEGLKFAAVKKATTIADLRAMPAADLVAADAKVEPFTRAVLGGVICIDGWALPQQFPTAIEQGLASDVATLTGFPTDDDLGVKPAKYLTTTVASFAKDVSRVFGTRAAAYQSSAETFLALCTPTTDVQARDLIKQTQVEFRMATMLPWFRQRARHARTPVYSYLFTQAMPCPEHPQFGAFHTSDMLYQFSNLDQVDAPWTADDQRVADQTSSYWVNFVKTLDPNGDDGSGNPLPSWMPVTLDQPTIMVLGAECGTRPLAPPERLRYYLDLMEKP